MILRVMMKDEGVMIVMTNTKIVALVPHVVKIVVVALTIMTIDMIIEAEKIADEMIVEMIAEAEEMIGAAEEMIAEAEEMIEEMIEEEMTEEDMTEDMIEMIDEMIEEEMRGGRIEEMIVEVVIVKNLSIILSRFLHLRQVDILLLVLKVLKSSICKCLTQLLKLLIQIHQGMEVEDRAVVAVVVVVEGAFELVVEVEIGIVVEVLIGCVRRTMTEAIVRLIMEEEEALDEAEVLPEREHHKGVQIDIAIKSVNLASHA
jgi:hypothetical protein